MILQTKPFTAFLNRNSRIKRGQPHKIYNIIITDSKQRQSLCFFCFWVGLANRRWGGASIEIKIKLGKDCLNGRQSSFRKFTHALSLF